MIVFLGGNRRIFGFGVGVLSKIFFPSCSLISGTGADFTRLQFCCTPSDALFGDGGQFTAAFSVLHELPLSGSLGSDGIDGYKGLH